MPSSKALAADQMPYWIIGSVDQDWYFTPIQAPSAKMAIEKSEEGNKGLEVGNEFEVWEVAELLPQRFITEVTVQPV